MNCTISAAVLPGLNAIGKLTPDTANPEPDTDAALIVTGVLPLDVKVTDCGVPAVFTTVLPKARLVALTLSVGTAAFNCRAKLLDTLPALARSVTGCVIPTDDTVAVNPILVAFAGTSTAAGTVTASLLLVKLTLKPPLGAAALSVTVQASVPDPVMDALLQESALNAAKPDPIVPVPLSVITVEWAVAELLAIANCPVASPAVVGLN